MNYNTLIVEEIPQGTSVTLNRIDRKNSLNILLIEELHQVLDQAEKNDDCRLIILKGQQGIFCTGMDFQEAAYNNTQGTDTIQFSSRYQAILKRFTSMPKIIVSIIDGVVMAGGVGLVAASDLVIATSKSQFTLSEALWGLLPANVLPYLIRRIGFQKAYSMTLTTQTVNVSEALAMHLIDELSDHPDEALRKYLLRLTRLDPKTILDLKNYFHKLWIISDDMEQLAILELSRLMKDQRIQNNIQRFIEQGKFPWEGKS